MVGRREGDIANVYADASLAEKELGWKATRGIKEMCMPLTNYYSIIIHYYYSLSPSYISSFHYPLGNLFNKSWIDFKMLIGITKT